MNILFVCSKNKWRSRTAESIFKNRPFDIVKSAGTENTARVKLTEGILKWADIIFVMEEKHEKKIVASYHDICQNKQIITLGIEDRYKYMDKELIRLLQDSVFPFLEE